MPDVLKNLTESTTKDKMELQKQSVHSNDKTITGQVYKQDIKPARRLSHPTANP